MQIQSSNATYVAGFSSQLYRTLLSSFSIVHSTTKYINWSSLVSLWWPQRYGRYCFVCNRLESCSVFSDDNDSSSLWSAKAPIRHFPATPAAVSLSLCDVQGRSPSPDFIVCYLFFSPKYTDDVSLPFVIRCFLLASSSGWISMTTSQKQALSGFNTPCFIKSGPLLWNAV